jgi:holo-[acyl-carrier protein] synthase
MIFGVGTDIIEVKRVEKILTRGEEHLRTIFTNGEIAYCETHGRKAEHYAARFAGKEAFLKAIGTGWRNGLSFAEIEILNDELGKPLIFLHGKVKDFVEKNQIKDISISLSHVKEIAIAVVILEK